MYPRGVCRRVLKLRGAWEGPLGKSCCCQPDSGNPTVRDERGACGNVSYGGTRIPPHNRKGACRKLSTYGCARRISTRRRFFAYVDAISPAAEVTRLWVLDTSNGNSIPVTDGLTAVWSPSWSLDGRDGRDGRRLFFASNRGGAMDLWQQRVAEDGSPVEAPKRLTTGIGVRQASFSADGTLLAYARGSRVANVWREPILSERLSTWDDAEQITFDQAFIEFIDVSPDGERLFVSSDRSGKQDLWTLPSEGGDMERLSSDPTPDWAPRLSPDGRQIVFYSYRTGNRDLWLMPAGGGPARQLTEHPGDDTMPRWSPDGRTIAFSSESGGNSAVSTISADGGEPESVSRHNIFVGWSVDASKIYVFGEGAFWESAPDGGPERKLTELSGRRGNVIGVSTDTDGRHFYFSWQEDLGDIWVMDVVTDESE